jgi:predicted nuclease of restriction endonuclease-like (RecB) superfamily
MSKDILPSDYGAFLQSIKTRVQQAQLQALVAVNKELILLYWHIGRAILDRQKEQGWGAKVIDHLAEDLHHAFPQMKGFSSRNLKYMRAFAEAYPDISFVQTVSAQITWSHNIALLEKVKDEKERLWYMQKTMEHGWSHSVLVHQMNTRLYQRQGKAITNFQSTLPTLQSDLAHDVLKDPYVFDFITTGEDTKERHLQSALLSHIQRFLLELGVGFTFVGSNYHVVVGDEDFYLDLLFYHLHLRCFVVIELKKGSFKPEHAGKVNFYLVAVDKQIKHPSDNPTIGLILCETKSRVTAEYALTNISSPVGVATYNTASLPDDLKEQLPDIQQIEASLQKVKESIEEGEEAP